MRSHRTLQTIAENNDRVLFLELNLLEERRLTSDLRNASYKQKLKQYYNSKIKIRKFRVGDLVLHKILGVQKDVLSPIWEGPLRVSKCLPNGAYELEDTKGIPAQYPWNATFLKKYYQ